MAIFVMFQIFLSTWVIIISLILPSHCCTLSSRQFAIEPSDKLSYKGMFVNFTCVVHEFDPLSDIIDWKVRPDINNTKVTVRYYEESRTALSIITVQVLNVQHLTCERVYSKHNLCFSSRRATLKVHLNTHFPLQSSLKCGPIHPDVFQEGDMLRSFCRVPRGDPPVDISWRLHPSVPTVYLPSAHRDDVFERMLEHTLPITQELHMKIIACEVTSEIVFPGRLIQCHIGPILVRKRPTVFVLPQNSEISYGHFVEFTCEAHGYPDQFNFSWSCLPDGVVFGCESVSKTANISLKQYVRLPDLVAVECTVSNGLDQGTDVAQLAILPSTTTNPTLITTTAKNAPCPKDIIINVTVHDEIDRRPDGDEKAFSCSISSNISSDIQFRWYLGDHKIQRDDPNFVIKNPSAELSYLRIADAVIEHNNKSILCVVDSRVCNVTYEGFVNLIENSEKQSMGTEKLSTLHSLSTIPYQVKTDNMVRASVSNSVILASPSKSIRKEIFHLTSSPYQEEYTSGVSGLPRSSHALSNNGDWQTITFALIGGLGVVIVVSCVVAAVSITMYRQLKKENLKNINSLRQELKTESHVSKEDVQLDLEHIYEDARIEAPVKVSKETFTPDTIHEFPNSVDQQCYTLDSSDNCSSYTNSARSSWSNSSGIYLDPNPDVHSLNRRLDFESNVHVENIYGNDKVFQLQVDKAMSHCKAKSAVRSLTRHEPALKGLQIPMPPIPVKYAK